MGQNECLLCVPLVAESVEDMLTQMREAKSNGADIVELRVDYLRNFKPTQDLAELIDQKVLPVIVTFRPNWEGGLYAGDEGFRREALSLAIQLQADFVDIELQVAEEFIVKQRSKRDNSCTKIVVSNHNYKSTPSIEDIGNLLARIQSTGADIIKFVTTARDVTDVSRVLQMLVHSQVPTIALVMGQKGLISRLLSPKFGGYLTFGSLSSGKESAPGQPTVIDLCNTYRLRNINCDTKIYGIIGNPVSHSKSPILHNAAFEQVGMNAVYVPYLVDNVAEFLAVYSAPDFAGFSVTIPFKEEALKCCDEVEGAAQVIGAVNTIIRRASDGKLIGYNTDCEAAISAIEDGVAESGETNGVEGKIFVVIGAGGAGKAIAFGAKKRGARVVIANRNFERAKILAKAIDAQAIEMESLGSYHPEDGMILANTTSLGMHPNVQDSPMINKEALKWYSVVFDAVYTPRETKLLKEAKEMGSVVVSGMEMFIRQAIAQFKLFTHQQQQAPEVLMRSIISELV